jgi:CRISPR-associated endoribonuclease Cas6
MSRLLIELKSTQNTKYETEYHYHLQGFIYGLMRGSVYDSLHDAEGSKLFSFSNIFPYYDLHKDDMRTFMISSPDTGFIKYLFDTLQLYIRRQTQINIGYMTFTINFIEEIYPKLPHSNVSLITGTPITIRIPKSKYKEFGYESVYDNFTFWRNEQPIDIFITQLTNNLLKKYAQYNTQTKEAYRNLIDIYKDIKLFDILKFKKQVATNVYTNSIQQLVIGSLWEIGFNNHISRDLVQFALDAGLGERNSLGFGFMNLTKAIYKENRLLEVNAV